MRSLQNIEACTKKYHSFVKKIFNSRKIILDIFSEKKTITPMFIFKFIITLAYYVSYPFLYITLRKHDFKQRTSFKNVYVDESIWIHAASLGEVNAVKPLVRRLLETYNRKTFVMTSNTKVGIAAAKEISGKLLVHHFPLDVPHVMQQAFLAFKPYLIILVETEIWPCMLNLAYKNQIPVVMVSARMSLKTLGKYRRLRWFLRKEFSTIKLICAQSESEADKYTKLKFKNVITANNLKFSVNLPVYESYVLRSAWKYQFNDFIVAIGSSRPGEEELIKDVYYELEKTIPRLKIIITPRHLQRLPEIEDIFDKNEYSLFSESTPAKPFLIVDEMGVLPQIYALSDVAIIGGSFFDYGGHNPLEAIWYEKIVIIGEYHQSCVATVDMFLEEKAIIVAKKEELVNYIQMLYDNTEDRINLGKKAKTILMENQQALDKHWNEIIKFVE